MDCAAFEELVSDVIEDALDGANRASAARHLLACPACRQLRAAVAAVTEDLARLAAPVPEGLAARVLLRVPPPPCVARSASASSRRTLGALEFRRAAGWAVVLIGLCWSAFGSAVEVFARERLVPLAEVVAAPVREHAPDVSLQAGARAVSDGIGAAGQSLHAAMFGAPPAVSSQSTDSPPGEP